MSKCHSMSHIYKTYKKNLNFVRRLSHILTQSRKFSYNPKIQSEKFINIRSIISRFTACEIAYATLREQPCSQT